MPVQTSHWTELTYIIEPSSTKLFYDRQRLNGNIVCIPTGMETLPIAKSSPLPNS